MTGAGDGTSIGLEQTRRRITRWRDTRTHRGAPMPAALWAAAIALARQHGLYTTARTLRVDYGSLKKRRDAAGAGRVSSPAFVELPVGPPGLGPCVIDLEAPARRPDADRGDRRDDGRPRDADAGGVGPRPMIQLTPQMRILVGVEAVDFRKGIDGLARACREVLAADPFSAALRLPQSPADGPAHPRL